MENLCDFCSTPSLELYSISTVLSKKRKKKGGVDDALNGRRGIEAFNTIIYSAESAQKLISTICKCSSCHLVQLSPRKPESLVVAQYTSSDATRHNNPSLYRVKSFERAMKNLKKVPLSLISSILDIGSASGEFLSTVQNKVSTCIGIEPNLNLSQLARANFDLNIHTGTLDNFKDQTRFDMITMWDVLEHVTSPRETLAKVNSKFKDQGLNKVLYSETKESKSRNYLILNLPMIDTLPAKFLGKFWPFYLEVHLFYFTMKTIESYMSELGFELLEKKRYWQTLPLRYLLERQFSVSLKWIPNIPVKYYLGQRTLVYCQIPKFGSDSN